MLGIDPVDVSFPGSPMNNVSCHPPYEHVDLDSIDQITYQDAFGFVQEDIDILIENAVPAGYDKRDEVIGKAKVVMKKWYDGYRAYVDVKLYNPWSVMSFIKGFKKWLNHTTVGRPLEDLAKEYWMNTDSTNALSALYQMADSVSNHIIITLIQDFHQRLKEPKQEPLLEVKFQQRTYDLNATEHKLTIDRFDDYKSISIETRIKPRALVKRSSVTNFMTTAYYHGYLTIFPGKRIGVPNLETLNIWYSFLDVNRLLNTSRSLLDLNQYLFTMNYKDFILCIKHFFILRGLHIGPATEEAFYHDLLYLFLAFPFSRTGYQDSTECKTGTGISDIIFIPDDPEKPGFILEVKRLSPSTSTGGESTPTKHSVTVMPSPPSSIPNGRPVAPSTSPMSIQFRSDQGDQAKHPMAMRPRPAKASGDQGRIPKCSIPEGPDKPSIPTKRSKLPKAAAVSKPKKTIFEQLKDLSEKGNRQVNDRNYFSRLLGKCTKAVVMVPVFYGKEYYIKIAHHHYSEEESRWPLDDKDQPKIEDEWFKLNNDDEPDSSSSGSNRAKAGSH